MCLKVKKLKPSIAKKEIICYKIFFKTENGLYISPYRGYHYGKFEEPIILISSKNGFDDVPDPDMEISRGIHSIKTLQKAKGILYDLQTTVSEREYGKFVILKCKILPTYHYWEGIFSYSFWDAICYCSNVLVIENLKDYSKTK